MAANRPPRPFATVCNRELGINDHYDVYSKVSTLSARWRQFAQSLHLGQDRIATIETNNDNCETRMSAVLDNWLRRNYINEGNGTPCWRLVCVAVKEGGGDAALAEEIAREHPLPAGVASTNIYVSPERNYSLLNKLYNLQTKFADAFRKTKISFNTQSELLHGIVDYLITHTVALLSPNRNNPVLAQKVMNEFKNIRTIEELFNILQHKYLSWFNYELVIKLVDEFLQENNNYCELRSTWSTYEQVLNDYFTNSGVLLKDAELVQFGDFNHPTPDTKVIVAKVDRDDYTLTDLFFFRRAISEELSTSEYKLYFSFVYTSSLYLEFWIPDFLYSVLFPMSKEQQQQLSDIGVTELKCDKYLYDLKKFASGYPMPIPIKRKLDACDKDLKARLGGVGCFFDQMVSNELISASCSNNNIDAIIRKFRSNHKLLDPQSSRTTYETFIRVLRESGMDDLAKKLEINWSAPHTKSGYRSKAHLATDSLQSQSETSIKDKDPPIQPNSSSDRPRSRPTSSWATQRNTQISMDQQTLVVGSQPRQAGVHDQHDKEKAENIPGDEIHTTTTSLALYLLKNGLQEPILLKMEPAIKKHQLTLAEMRKIILNEAIPCNFFVITFSDLHSSRKSTLIRDYLGKVTYTIEIPSRFRYTCNDRGLSVYNATLLKQCPNNAKYLWFAPEKALKVAVSCGSAILHMSLHYGYKLQVLSDDAPSDVFKDQILDSYLKCVCSNLKEVIQGSHELQQILSSAAIHMNIIDNDTRKGAREFLSLISHHLSSNLSITWLTMDDIKELDIPLILRQKRQRHTDLVVEARIRSIIYAAKAHSQISEIPVTFIIMCSKKSTISERDKAKDTLLKAIRNEMKRLSLQLQPTILVLDPSSSDDMKKLNHELDKIVNAQCLVKKHIKLSWLFLHNAMSSLDDVVISYSKLKNIAEKIGIKDGEYDKFLETFTKFMHILYLPTFKSLQNVVILRPVEFINKLSTLFEKPKGFNGIYNMEQLHEEIPNKELADAIVNALCSLGLALKTTAEQVDKRTSSLKDPSTPLVFIPLTRGDTSHMHVEKSSIASLFILFNMEINLPIPDCLSFFASELLTLKGASLLSDEISKPNIFKILLQITRHDYNITLIFQGTYIEVIVENYVGRGDDVLGKILQSCKDALDRMSSILIKFTYKLALECLAQAQVSTAGYIDLPKKDFEFLPNKKLCHNCEVSANLLRKKWREVIHKMYDNEVKERDRIKFDKLLDLAHDLGHVIKSISALKNLATQLGITVEREFLTVLQQSCSPWQRVFTILLLWEKKEEPTKEKLKSALKRLGHLTSILD